MERSGLVKRKPTDAEEAAFEIEAGPQGRRAASRATEQRGRHDVLAESLPHVSGNAEGDARDGERPGPHAVLRVASFNVRTWLGRDGRNSWPLRAGACAAAIAGLEADVVGLQEVRPLQERGLARRLPGYAGAGAGRDDGHGRGERCTVVYRPSRLTLDAWTVRWFSDTPWDARLALLGQPDRRASSPSAGSRTG